MDVRKGLQQIEIVDLAKCPTAAASIAVHRGCRSQRAARWGWDTRARARKPRRRRARGALAHRANCARRSAAAMGERCAPLRPPRRHSPGLGVRQGFAAAARGAQARCGALGLGPE